MCPPSCLWREGYEGLSQDVCSPWRDVKGLIWSRDQGRGERNVLVPCNGGCVTVARSLSVSGPFWGRRSDCCSLNSGGQGRGPCPGPSPPQPRPLSELSVWGTPHAAWAPTLPRPPGRARAVEQEGGGARGEEGPCSGQGAPSASAGLGGALLWTQFCPQSDWLCGLRLFSF